jgi:membrane complex biogenesis BtpA family protein
MLTSKDVSLIGMIHVPALPGTPRNRSTPDEIIEIAVQEAFTLQGLGFHAILLENMHDAPYLKRNVGPEITAMMSAVVAAVNSQVELPVGVQILAGANKEAIAVAHAGGAQFIRAEGFVYAHVADEGIIESDAGELLRYRKQIGAGHVLIAADIKKKHSSHAITADVSLEETAHTAEFFGADILVVTGTSTGRSAELDDLKACERASLLPRMVGSGINPENLSRYWPHAHGFIVGSYLKKDGFWANPLDPDRAKRMVEAFEKTKERLG